MQFSIFALDHTDDEALNRRLNHRDEHLNGLRGLAGEGKFISGGAILDGEGRMVGSNAFFAFADRAELEAWLKTEPYVTGRVWDKIEVREIRLFAPAT